MIGRINLYNVSLVCVDDATTKEAYSLLTKICREIKFGDVKLFSSIALNKNVTVIDPIKDIHDYDNFIYHNLNKYIQTDYCMIVQTDGHPINFAAWDDKFLQFDYIAAPWLWNIDVNFQNKVGNSGFCIRSKKLLQTLSEKYPNYDSNKDGPEDEHISVKIDYFLKQNEGVDFAPVEVAQKFSVENSMYLGQFGFHGKSTRKMNKAVGIDLRL